MHINQSLLSSVIQAALAEVAGDKRWTNATMTAAKLIEDDSFLPTTNGTLLIFSDSGLDYNSSETDCRTGDKPCRAFELGFPCRHRALVRLVTLLETSESATNN